MVKCICINCEKIFSVKESLFKRGVGKYCSLVCRNIGYKKTFSSINNPFWGRKHSQETKDMMKNSHRKISHDYIKTKYKKNDPRVTGENSHNWNGGKYKHSAGYIFKKIANNTYDLEHRIVGSQILGRPLKNEEQVHHMGNKDDNRKHMLIIFSSNSAHQRFHHNPNNVKEEEILFDGRKIKT